MELLFCSILQIVVADILSTDAYIGVYSDDTFVGQTKVVKNSLRPVWNEHFTSVLIKKGTLRIKLFDHDTFNDDDYLGQVTLPRKEDVEEVTELPVQQVDDDIEAKGTVSFRAYIVVCTFFHTNAISYPLYCSAYFVIYDRIKRNMTLMQKE